MLAVKKIEQFWVVFGTHKDGTKVEYRFATKKEAIQYYNKYA